MEEQRRIIEVSGVKLDVDLRTVKTVDTYRVGQGVKVLVSEYGTSYSVYPGVIAGFDDFPSKPTITIAYLTSSYTPELKFVTVTPDSNNIEILPLQDFEIEMERKEIIQSFNRAIESKKAELRDLKQKKNYFIKKFQEVFKFIDSGNNDDVREVTDGREQE